MNILVFDTETIGLEKCYCYNVGYVIYDTDTEQTILEREYVVEQIWHNRPLFETAYYANKRPIYVNRMRGRKIALEKWGKICKQMKKDIENYNISFAYAYNSPFDTKVFDFNCEWYHKENPFDTVTILDIRGNVHNKIAFTEDFKNFCEDNGRFTDSGNYSTTAETLFQYIAKNLDFVEEHTALSDSRIELEILKETFRRGCEIGKEYKTYSSVPRRVEKKLVIENKITGEVVFTTNYTKRTNREKGDRIIIE